MCWREWIRECTEIEMGGNKEFAMGNAGHVFVIFRLTNCFVIIYLSISNVVL